MQKSYRFLTYDKTNRTFAVNTKETGKVFGLDIQKTCVVTVDSGDKDNLLNTLNNTLKYIADLFATSNIDREILEYGKKDMIDNHGRVVKLIQNFALYKIGDIDNIDKLYAEADKLKEASNHICSRVNKINGSNNYKDELNKRIFQYTKVHKEKIYNSKIYLYGGATKDKKYMIIDAQPQKSPSLISLPTCIPTTNEKELFASKINIGNDKWIDCQRDAYYYTPKTFKCQLFDNNTYIPCEIIGLEFRDDPTKLLLAKDPRIIIQYTGGQKIVNIDQICIVSNSQPGGSYTNPSVQSINEYNNNDTNKYNKAYMKYKQQYLDTKYSY